MAETNVSNQTNDHALGHAVVYRIVPWPVICVASVTFAWALRDQVTATSTLLTVEMKPLECDLLKMNRLISGTHGVPQ